MRVAGIDEIVVRGPRVPVVALLARTRRQLEAGGGNIYEADDETDSGRI